MIRYEASPGDSIDTASRQASELAFKSGESVEFDFNGAKCVCLHDHTIEENRVSCRAALGLPSVDPPFHPITAMDALERWDKGQSVFTIEMGGIGPGYEQAIQILVFEIIRDFGKKPLPDGKTFGEWGDSTVSRIDDACGGFSGAQVGAAKQVAYRAIRDGWNDMLKSVPEDRKIQVSKDWPKSRFNANP